MLIAPAAPMETPTPTPPPATAAVMAPTIALIVDVSDASIATSPEPTRVLSPIYASVVLKIRFNAAAPAPLTETPTPPTLTARETAVVSELIVAPSLAVTATLFTLRQRSVSV